jgi:hypothetical protein
MVAVVSAETVLLVLLLVLVAGLLRSHAEILKRLSAAERRAGADGADGQPGGIPAPPVTPPRSAESSPPALAGITPAGDAVALALAAPGSRPTLLAFLTSGCASCADFWDTLGEPRLPPGIEILIVTHGSERESPSRLRKLAPEHVPVVMSSTAWADYRVPGSPYFVLVDGHIRGEGVATSWSALASLVGDAIEDQRDAESAGAGPNGSTGPPGAARPAGSAGARRARDIDATLTAAGIGPGHESLYPGTHPSAE